MEDRIKKLEDELKGFIEILVRHGNEKRELEKKVNNLERELKKYEMRHEDYFSRLLRMDKEVAIQIDELVDDIRYGAIKTVDYNYKIDEDYDEEILHIRFKRTGKGKE